jgi:hypothetical protein
LRIELVSSEETGKLQEWDRFQMTCPRGHYCALSTWLASFGAYGFDFGVVTARDDEGTIRGGAGFAMFNRFGCRVMTIPIGPTVDESAESMVEPILTAAYEHGCKKNVALLQVTIPYAPGQVNPALLRTFSSSLPLRDGRTFGTVNAPPQMLWVEFPQIESQEEWSSRLLGTFKKNTRRDIRASERQDLQCIPARTESELRDAFAVIENNGRERGYPTRQWADFAMTAVSQVSRGHAMLLTAVHEGHIVGAHYSVLAGKRCSYVMGGTVRTGEGLLVGHFLHWNVMKKAREIGLFGYDLTSQASLGVMHFKMGFCPKEIHFISPKYAVLSETRYQAFKFLYPRVLKHRQIVARLLRSLTRLTAS